MFTASIIVFPFIGSLSLQVTAFANLNLIVCKLFATLEGMTLSVAGICSTYQGPIWCLLFELLLISLLLLSSCCLVLGSVCSAYSPHGTRLSLIILEYDVNSRGQVSIFALANANLHKLGAISLCFNYLNISRITRQLPSYCRPK